MEEFSKIVEAYRWRGDASKKNQGASVYASPALASPCNGEDDAAGSSRSPHKKNDRGRSSFPTPSLPQTEPLNVGLDAHMHITQTEPKSSVSDDNDDDGGSLSFSPSWYRPGQKHLLTKRPRSSLRRRRSSRQLVFCVEDMSAKMDAEESIKSKVKTITKKKRRRTETKQNVSKVSSEQGGIEACNMPDFYDDSGCEDGPTEFCSPAVAYSPGLVSQQSLSKLANTKASRKRKGRLATRRNCVTRHVLMNAKSPFFTPLQQKTRTSTFKKGKKTLSNVLISKPEDKTAVVKTYTRRRNKGDSVSLNNVSTIEIDNEIDKIKQSSGHYSDSADCKKAGDQSAHPSKEAVVCLDSGVVPVKGTFKAKKSAYFTTTVKALGQRDILNRAWVPPVSVHALIQEELYQDPWKVLVACMLLNKTSGTQMRRVIWDLFALCPTPEAAVAVETDKVERVIRPLGLQKKRARMIQKFSKDYLGKEWLNLGELHGIGKYATDAYAIFCEGRWREVKPEDHKLVDYWQYLCATDGLGYAFKDDREKIAEGATSSVVG